MKALLVIDMLNDFINVGGALETGVEGRDIVPFMFSGMDDTESGIEELKTLMKPSGYNIIDLRF